MQKKISLEVPKRGNQTGPYVPSVPIFPFWISRCANLAHALRPRDRVLNLICQEDKAQKVNVHVSLFRLKPAAGADRSIMDVLVPTALPLCVPVLCLLCPTSRHVRVRHECVHVHGVQQQQQGYGGGGISPVHRPPLPSPMTETSSSTTVVLTLWVPWKPLDEPTGYYS